MIQIIQIMRFEICWIQNLKICDILQILNEGG